MTAPVSSDESRCGSIFPWFGPCPGEPVAVVTTGCVHEHITVKPICRECLTLWQTGDLPGCYYCATASTPHDCDKALLEVRPC